MITKEDIGSVATEVVVEKYPDIDYGTKFYLVDYLVTRYNKSIIKALEDHSEEVNEYDDTSLYDSFRLLTLYIKNLFK